jgi:hypothetical protein
MKTKFTLLLLALFAISNNSKAQSELICNGDFEDNIQPSSINLVNDTLIDCWSIIPANTNFGNIIEVWKSSNAFSGSHYVEINGYGFDTLYQTFTISAGSNLEIRFAHKGRSGSEEMGIEIGPIGGPFDFVGSFSDSTEVWGEHSAYYTTKTAPNNEYVIRFYSIGATLAPSFGNFIDAISVREGSPSSIEKRNKTNEFKVYPNPTKSFVTIQLPQHLGQASLQVLSINGTIVYSSNIGDFYQLNTSAFAKGIYILNINTQDEVHQQKLIVE